MPLKYAHVCYLPIRDECNYLIPYTLYPPLTTFLVQNNWQLAM